MKKFWNWKEEDGERTLRLEGPIDEDDFWGDGVTPKAFRDELDAGEGNVTVWINSEGGSVFAAAEIYTMLRDYPGKVTVRIASVAASAASVVAMAGDTVQMSPTALLFLHDPSTIAIGNAKDMERAIETLDAVKDSIINAYRAKTGLSRARLSKLMEDESWIHAEEALKLGFCDEILFADKKDEDPDEDDGKAVGIDDPDDPDDPDEPDRDDDPDDPDDPDKDDDPDEDDAEERRQASNEADVRIYSMRKLNLSIMNHIKAMRPAKDGAAVDDNADPAVEDEAVEAADMEAANTEPDKSDESDADCDTESVSDGGQTDDSRPPGEPKDAGPQGITIGPDGKTKDGAMPYELLKRQLDFLR